MAAKRKTSAKTAARRTAKAARTLNISPVLLTILLILFAGIAYSAYLEAGGASVPAAAVDSFISKDADLEIHFIDVGQGDCALIKWEGAAALIDSGERDYSDTVLDYLKKQNVDKLDYVIATHPHSDHMGSMSDIISKTDVGKVIAPKVKDDLVPTTKTYERFLSALKEKALKLTAAKPGTVYELSGKTAAASGKTPPKLEILAPVGDYDDLNNYSVTVKLTYGTTSYLFTGDIEQQAERDIIDSGANLKADVLKVAHHGSSSSTSGEFWNAVSPKICVIQCGTGNSYGHPHAETVHTINGGGAELYRNDLNGDIVIYSDGREIFVKAEKGE